MFGHQSLEKLRLWQSRLEEQYVRLAMSIAQYEGELDLARAGRAIELANKHLISREALQAAKDCHTEAVPEPEPEPV